MPVTAQQQGMIFFHGCHHSLQSGLCYFCLPQSKDEGQVVKLSKMNGLKKVEDEEEKREMITPALREALTKQGEQKIVCIKWNKWGTKIEILKMIYNQGCFYCWWSFMTLTHLGNSVATYARTSAGCHWIIYSYYQASLLCNTKKITLQKELTSCFSAYPWPCSSQSGKVVIHFKTRVMTLDFLILI